MSPRAEHGEVLVVGGGVAGAAAALRLARAGRRVTLLERDKAAKPKVCGEFLSCVALAELEALGIDLPGLGAAPLTSFAIVGAGGSVRRPLPFKAASLTRHNLDERLRQAARDAGATVRLGENVRRVERRGEGWRAHTGDRSFGGQVLMIATGKTDLRGHRRGRGLHSGLVGLKRYVRLSPAAARRLGSTVELITFPGGYCGVQPVEAGLTNACLVIDGDRLKSLGRPDAVFDFVAAHAARAAELFDGSKLLTSRPLAVASLPYGYVRRRSDGAYFLGDQAAAVASFCGEGIAMALASARFAARDVGASGTAAAYQARFAGLVGGRVRAAALLSRILCGASLQRAALFTARAVPALCDTTLNATRISAHGHVPLDRSDFAGVETSRTR